MSSRPSPSPRQAPVTAECKRLLDLVRRSCPGLLPADPLPAGGVAPAVAVGAREVQPLVALAALQAAAMPFGAEAQRDPSVLWREGERELLVRPAKVRARFSDGVVAISIPVSCEQVGDAVVHVSFVVGTKDRPAGMLAATDERPRGPTAVVDAWGEALVAFAWHVLLEVTGGLAGEAGRDVDGSRLLPMALGATPDGLQLTPMARHAFDRRRG